MEKQRITVTLAGRTYTLASSDPPEHVRRVAEYADRKISETAALTHLSSAQVAVLTCLNLADELLKAQDENTFLRRQMERQMEQKPEQQKEQPERQEAPQEKTEE